MEQKAHIDWETRMSREDEIREREQKATKGPWAGFPDSEDAAAFAIYGLDGWWVAETSSDYSDRTTEQKAADCDFIAHAREDVPWLLAENARLRAEIEELRKQDNEFWGTPQGV